MDKSANLQVLAAPGETAYIACGVCQREIPLSVTLWREGSDYAAYFCGFECYDRWRNLTTTAAS
jgi:hypothetical protein